MLFLWYICALFQVMCPKHMCNITRQHVLKPQDDTCDKINEFQYEHIK